MCSVIVLAMDVIPMKSVLVPDDMVDQVEKAVLPALLHKTNQTNRFRGAPASRFMIQWSPRPSCRL